MTTLFQFIDSISKTKEYLFNEDNPGEYSKFMVNRGLSYNADLVFFSNELNKFADIPEKAHYEFLLHSVDKKSRYGKWIKKEASDSDMELVMELYGYSRQQAETALEILNEKQLERLRSLYGGKK